MPRAHHYRAVVTWTGAAKGPTSAYQLYSREFSVSIAGKPDLHGSADTSFRGDPAMHNPEDLLLVALSSCHMLEYLSLCARNGVLVTAYVDQATATMEPEDGKTRFTDAILRPRVTVASGSDTELASRLHDTAHEGCYIASSVAFPVRCEPVIEIAEPAPALRGAQN